MVGTKAAVGVLSGGIPAGDSGLPGGGIPSSSMPLRTPIS